MVQHCDVVKYIYTNQRVDTVKTGTVLFGTLHEEAQSVSRRILNYCFWRTSKSIFLKTLVCVERLWNNIRRNHFIISDHICLVPVNSIFINKVTNCENSDRFNERTDRIYRKHWITIRYCACDVYTFSKQVEFEWKSGLFVARSRFVTFELRKLI